MLELFDFLAHLSSEEGKYYYASQLDIRLEKKLITKCHLPSDFFVLKVGRRGED